MKNNRPAKLFHRLGPQVPLNAMLLSVCFSVCVFAACPSSRRPSDAGPQTLTLTPTGQNSADLAFLTRQLNAYQLKTGIRIKTLAGYDSVDTRLRLLQDLFANRSPEPDICEIDNIWPGILADDLIDLKPYLGDEMTAVDQRSCWKRSLVDRTAGCHA